MDLKKTFACADLGNSFYKMCIFKNNKIIARKRLPYLRNHESAFKEAALWLKNKCISELVLLSVNISANRSLISTFKKNGIKVTLLEKTLPSGLKTSYNLASLGMDRLANIVAARNKYKAENIIIASCGTALTIDIIEKNIHIGGFIAPGLNTLVSSLNKATDLLPLVIPHKGKISVARKTSDAIDWGCRLLLLGGISRLAQHIENLRKRRYLVIATGGHASLITKEFKDLVIDRDLTFKGIRLLSGDFSGSA